MTNVASDIERAQQLCTCHQACARDCPVCHSPSWQDGPCVRQRWLELKYSVDPGTRGPVDPHESPDETDIVSRAIDFMESLGLRVELWQAKALRRILVGETEIERVYSSAARAFRPPFFDENAPTIGEARKYGGTRKVSDEERDRMNGGRADRVVIDEAEFMKLPKGEPGIGSSGAGGNASEPWQFEGRTFIHNPETGKTEAVGVPFIGVFIPNEEC